MVQSCSRAAKWLAGVCLLVVTMAGCGSHPPKQEAAGSALPLSTRPAMTQKQAWAIAEAQVVSAGIVVEAYNVSNQHRQDGSWAFFFHKKIVVQRGENNFSIVVRPDGKAIFYGRR